MNAPIDETGNKFHRLTAVRRIYNGKRGTPWEFKCDCGNIVISTITNVKHGTTKSCGCLLIEVLRERSITHGHSVNRKRSKTLKLWYGAKSRCFNPNDERYPNYGERGITMCERWSSSFQNFLDDMGECPSGKSIDRIDVNGNYEPGNCSWATSMQQARNRTDNVYVSHNGTTMILKDFASVMGVGYKNLHRHVRMNGADPHEAAAYLKSKSI